MSSVRYGDWEAKVETRHDVITASAVERLHNLLDSPGEAPSNGEPLPALWHWLTFLPEAPQRNLGPDGHPRRGGFHPPVELPRRMFVGGRLTFHRPIAIGDSLTRVAEVIDVTPKEGSTGKLVFETIKVEIHSSDGLVISEEQDIVYRDFTGPQEALPVTSAHVPDATWQHDLSTESTLLFRFSALTYNAHKIHYDRSWATEVEGYPGLVVHGPLQAIALAELWRRNRPEVPIGTFEFRLQKPAFDNGPLHLRGQLKTYGGGVALDAYNGSSELSTRASAAPMH